MMTSSLSLFFLYMTVTIWVMSIAWSLSMYFRTIMDGRHFDTPVLDYLLLLSNNNKSNLFITFYILSSDSFIWCVNAM